MTLLKKALLELTKEQLVNIILEYKTDKKDVTVKTHTEECEIATNQQSVDYHRGKLVTAPRCICNQVKYERPIDTEVKRPSSLPTKQDYENSMISQYIRKSKLRDYDEPIIHYSMDEFEFPIAG